MPLSQNLAEQRAKYVKKGSISYNFHLKFLDQSYEGYAELVFHLKEIPEILPIDFYESSQIKCLIVNQKVIEDIPYNQEFLEIQAPYLNLGKNQIIVVYQNYYDGDGHGCTKSLVDNKNYLFTQFQAYNANKVFPLFDQPDLKAKMRLSTLTLEDWGIVISNQVPIIKTKVYNIQEYILSTKNINNMALKEFLNDFKGKMSIFNETQQVSTYLYAFIVGNYEEIIFETTYKNIPMSLYFSKQISKEVNDFAPILNKSINEAFSFFQNFFQCPYPFSKYDQIVVADDFREIAMQNVGCVTMNCRIFTCYDLKIQLVRAISVLIHELCHHWYGNLVTMRWWNDLWLNQSVTQFMASLCLKNIQKLFEAEHHKQNIDRNFQFKSPEGSYDETTVRGEIQNTYNIDNLFNSTVYNKGTLIIKQLYYLVGHQAFRKALGSLINSYKYSNANLQQFIEEVQKYYKQKNVFTLTQWSKVWLEKPSFNILDPIFFDPTDRSPESKIIIEMKPFNEDYPILRPHKIKIALIKESGEIDQLQLLLEAKTINQVRYDGRKQYKAILLNYQKYSFAQIKIDENSKAYFQQNSKQINRSARQHAQKILKIV